MKEGCMLGITKVNILAYADDLVLIASSKSDMDALYIKLRSMIGDHKLQMNRSKSKCLMFSKSVFVSNPPSISVGGDDLEVVKCYKYLGHFIESTLQDCTDVEFRLNKSNSSTASSTSQRKLNGILILMVECCLFSKILMEQRYLSQLLL